MSIEEAFRDWLRVIDKKELFGMVSIVNNLYSNSDCTPEYKNIFKPFQITPFNKLKVVMLFSNPYIEKGTATGIALANAVNTRELSPVLNKIKDYVIDLQEGNNFSTFDPTLENWCRQGILLLNTSMTAEVGKPGSHKLYWQEFMTDFIKALSVDVPGLIYVLWGNTKEFERYIATAATIFYMEDPEYYNTHELPDILGKVRKAVEYYWAETIHF